MSSQYIYTMNRVSKVVPPKRQIIKDISLSFFPGAKIGLLGLNGAGKSTVLKIMAGVDTDFEGEARPQPGIKVGYLAQEPELDPTKTVREAVEEGVGEVLQAQAALDAVYRPTPRKVPTSMRWPRSRNAWRRSGRWRRAHPGKPAGRGRRCAAPAAVGCHRRQAVRW
ncbi:ATP-binding cassette domain-containing protein [Stenotrophomonas sp. CD2]|nr:ATP-binding cassette domain-containing protein [Stenotrophomonas sp. CD2]